MHFLCYFLIDRKSEDAVHKATKKDKDQMLLVKCINMLSRTFLLNIFLSTSEILRYYA